MPDSNEQIFEYEGITQPSYWSRQPITETGLKAMDQIAATGANTLTLVPNFFQDNKESNSVYLKLDPNNPWGSESDTFEQVKQAISEAKARGLKVVLKPHIETLDRKWRATFEPEDPKAWFDSYKAMMVGYAQAAQEAGAEMLTVGTEMDSMIDPTKSFVIDSETGATKTYTQAWGEIIDAVRAVYSGKVTYAATYWTVQKVGFWDKVDYIGVDAYIPSSTVNDPTVQQIVDAWVKPHFNSWVRDDLHGGKSVVDYYKSLSEQYGKQVIFTEVGYRSMDGANKDPGVFGGDGEVDLQEQVDGYTALFEVMENYGGQWLAGSFMWSYYSFENPMEERGVSWTDYTTQHKPANLTVTEHYSSPAHVTGLVWNGTSAADKLDGGYHNDTISGAGGEDRLWGGCGHDRIRGGEGADSLTGSRGNDIVDGETGTDTALFSGALTDYTIYTLGGGRFVVKDKRQGGDGTDELRDVEKVSFNGTTMDLDTVETDSPSESVLSIAAVQEQKLEGAAGAMTDFTFSVTRSSDIGSATAKWRVKVPAGSLTAEDFAVMSGEVSFETGQTERMITVQVRGDATFETDEAFTVELYDPGEGSSIGTGVAGSTIVNDDFNHLPGGLSLSVGTAQELAVAGTRVGTLSAADPDPGDAFTYTLINPDGRFEIVGNEILVKNGFLLDHEQARSHTLTVRVQDRAGAIYDAELMVAVGNVAKEKTRGSAFDDKFVGGKYADRLGGELGKDALWGGLGKDVLTGGKGKDAFVFHTKPNKKRNLDKITDFKVKDDSIWLENRVFKKLGKKGTEKKPTKIKKAFFTLGEEARDGNDYLIYDSGSGRLSYDRDGAGSAAAVEIAKLKKGLKMTHHDFFVI